MKESIFSRLFHYKETPNMKPEENYLTEMLSWMVDMLPQFGREYVQFLTEQLNDKNITITDSTLIHSNTQIYADRCFIDMVITTDIGIGFICEHKVDAKLRDSQIRDYFERKAKLSNGDHIDEWHTVLLTKKSEQHTQEADIKIIWKQIFDLFSKKQNNENEKIIVDQFLLYLTEVGMGMKQSICLESIQYYGQTMKIESVLKSIFTELKQEVEWKTMCPNLERFLETSGFEPAVKKHYGRIGIEFAKKWEPSIFAGVILDNSDHQLDTSFMKNEDEPIFVVLIDCLCEKRELYRGKEWFKTISDALNDKNNKEDEFYVEKEPKSPWRLIILKKRLGTILQKEKDYEEQKNRIQAEIVEGINLLLAQYNELQTNQ